ncbi:MAG: amidohydrolase family protein, partial [Candidatus Dormibacteraceae bacterium]
LGLAEVDECRGGDRDQVEHLRIAVRDQGLRGLYYATLGLLFGGHHQTLDDERFEPLWKEVRHLGIPVFWEVLGAPVAGSEDLLAQIEHLNRWADRHPDIPCLFTHGFSPELLDAEIPEPVLSLLHREQFLIEVLWPISWGRDHRYPYGDLVRPLRNLLREAGASRLVWGSDMPNVLRHCTYEQSRSYLPALLRKVGAGGEEEAAIFGGNLRKLLSWPPAGTD